MPIKITDLPAVTTLDATDVLPIVDISEDITKQVTVSQITGIIPPITINGTPLEPGDSLTITAVTSLSTNNGITGGPISSTGTIGLTGTALSLHNLATNGIVSKSGTTLSTVPGAISINGTPVPLGNSASVGTVTSISTNNGITGGPITGIGTIALTGTALSLHNLAGIGIIKKTGATTLSTVSDTITINDVSATLGTSVTIPVGGNPASPANSVQFNNGGAFGGSSNLTWDNTNSRLGIATSSPTSRLHVTGDIALSGSIISDRNDSENILESKNTSASRASQFYLKHNLANVEFGNSRGNLVITNGNLGIGISPSAKLHVNGNTILNGTSLQLGAQTYTVPASAGGANTVLTNNGSGVLSWLPGGTILNVTRQAGNYLATTSDNVIEITSSSPATVTLYTASGNTGRLLHIKRTGTAVVTITPNGSETIDGSVSSYLLNTANQTLSIVSNGIGWIIL